MREAAECELQTTEIGKRIPSWFYMTNSEYCIDLGDVKLFELSKEAVKAEKSSSKFFSWYYASFLEGLFNELPRIVCPVPADLYAYIDTFDKLNSLTDKLYDLVACSTEMPVEVRQPIEDNLDKHLIDIGEIITPPQSIVIRMLRFYDEIVIHHESYGEVEVGVSYYSATSGEYRLSYQDFVSEVEDLLNRFFARMDKQVKDVVANFTAEEVTQSNIIAEHEERRKYFYEILDNVKQGKYDNLVDWKKVREDLAYVLERS